MEAGSVGRYANRSEADLAAMQAVDMTCLIGEADQYGILAQLVRAPGRKHAVAQRDAGMPALVPVGHGRAGTSADSR